MSLCGLACTNWMRLNSRWIGSYYLPQTEISYDWLYRVPITRAGCGRARVCPCPVSMKFWSFSMICVCAKCTHDNARQLDSTQRLESGRWQLRESVLYCQLYTLAILCCVCVCSYFLSILCYLYMRAVCSFSAWWDVCYSTCCVFVLCIICLRHVWTIFAFFVCHTCCPWLVRCV